VKNTLAVPSFEKEPPLKPSGLAAERCVQRILKEQRPPGYADSVSPFLASKNKGIPQKIRAGPHPKPPLRFPPPNPQKTPPSLALTLTDTNTQNSKATSGVSTNPPQAKPQCKVCSLKDSGAPFLLRSALAGLTSRWEEFLRGGSAKRNSSTQGRNVQYPAHTSLDITPRKPRS
ncbi:hypothetical protein JOQ06_020333, partial [Pogonophryne albipinna]